MQNRSQGRIFMCPTFSGSPKEFLMGRSTATVSASAHLHCTSPISFHKTAKDLHGRFKNDKDTHSNLIPLQSPKLQIPRLFRTSSSLTIRQLKSVYMIRTQSTCCVKTDLFASYLFHLSVFLVL